MAIDLGFDEGGSGNRLLVSVQVGVCEQAKKLKRNWKRRLPEGLPYFHSKDFGSQNGGAFTKAGLDRKDREILLSDLGGMIRQYLLFAVTARVSISEYESLTTQDFRSRSGTAYGFAVNACLLSAYSLVKELGYRPDFNILIERGHRNSQQVAQILEGLRKIPAEMQREAGGDVIPDIRIVTAGLGEKKDHPILQAADMVAYSEWQGLIRGDPAIWNAINDGYGAYVGYRVHLDTEGINIFVKQGLTACVRKQRKRAKSHENKQGVSAVRSDDAELDERSAQRDKSGSGGGESGEATEKTEG